MKERFFDKEGNWIEYVYHADTKQYTAEEQAFNKKLFDPELNDRSKIFEFLP